MVTKIASILVLFFCIAVPSSAQTAAPPDQKIEVVFREGRKPPTVRETINRARVRAKAAQQPKALPATAPVRPVPPAAEPVKPEVPPTLPEPPVAPKPETTTPPIITPPADESPPSLYTRPGLRRIFQSVKDRGIDLLPLLPFLILIEVVRKYKHSKRYAILIDQMNAYADLCHCGFAYHLQSLPAGQRTIRKKVRTNPHRGKFYLWLKRPGFPSGKEQRRSVDQVLDRVANENATSPFRKSKVFYRRGWVVIEIQHIEGGDHE